MPDNKAVCKLEKILIDAGSQLSRALNHLWPLFTRANDVSEKAKNLIAMCKTGEVDLTVTAMGELQAAIDLYERERDRG